jgi:hypothetical protein
MTTRRPRIIRTRTGGRDYYYFRASRGKLTRLPGCPGDAAFDAAYQRLLEARPKREMDRSSPRGQHRWVESKPPLAGVA